MILLFWELFWFYETFLWVLGHAAAAVLHAGSQGPNKGGPPPRARPLCPPHIFSISLCSNCVIILPRFLPRRQKTHAKQYKQTFPRHVKPGSLNLQLQQKRANDTVVYQSYPTVHFLVLDQALSNQEEKKKDRDWVELKLNEVQSWDGRDSRLPGTAQLRTHPIDIIVVIAILMMNVEKKSQFTQWLSHSRNHSLKIFA